MNNALGIALGLTLTASVAVARVAAATELPGAVPAARISQQIGTTDIKVDYGSPAVLGRRIWGGVVAYDQPWTISPNGPAIIQFGEDVLVGGKPVAAGSYRLVAVPGKAAWTFVLGAAQPAEVGREAEAPAEVARFRVPVKNAAFRERLVFLFSNFDNEKTSLDLEWEKIRVSIPITTRSTERISAEMNQLDNVWRSYANAARFMLESEKDFDSGLKYADQSLALKQDWYTYWIKAALLAAKHDYKAALEEGQRARELGRQQLGDGFALESELERTLAVWKRAPVAKTR